jgi:hypothetical protein
MVSRHRSAALPCASSHVTLDSESLAQRLFQSMRRSDDRTNSQQGDFRLANPETAPKLPFTGS